MRGARCAATCQARRAALFERMPGWRQRATVTQARAAGRCPSVGRRCASRSVIFLPDSGHPAPHVNSSRRHPSGSTAPSPGRQHLKRTLPSRALSTIKVLRSTFPRARELLKSAHSTSASVFNRHHILRATPPPAASEGPAACFGTCPVSQSFRFSSPCQHATCSAATPRD
jgi:hypothetical protein